jgi:hypothetical protein
VENKKGKLAPGFEADFVVLDRGVMRTPPEEVLRTKVLRRRGEKDCLGGALAYGFFYSQRFSVEG